MYHEAIIPTMNFPFKIFIFNTKSSDRLIPPHWHASVELLFCLSGKLEVQFPNKRFSLSEQDVLFINSNIIHSSRSPLPGKCLAIQIPLDFLADATENQYGNRFLYKLTPQNATPELKVILMRIKKQLSKENLWDRLTTKASVYELIAELTKNFCVPLAGIKEIESAKHLPKLKKVNDYLATHHKERLSLTSVAEHFNYNPSYFSRFYKKFMGVSFSDYLSSIRLLEAYSKLRDTDHTILEIALDSGFSTVKSFYNAFTKHYGTSPQQYRKQYFKR
ncbi:AraC family transcriptional regulator [Listeria aquatica]|uniref:AraC family transcriptional regulator n=1 Tax=Listeria aquatica TaxID=1494960 RepID=A0A841ZM07_9LIST|nr:AraC family transcriptional regulator [Listeria aquatica]